MIAHLCYNYPCLGNIKTAFVVVWNNLQTCYNLLLTPLVKVAAFPRQEPPTLRGVFLFGDKMGTIKFTPSNELETREWFAAHISEFDFSIIKSRAGFPDYILEDSNGKQYGVEVEYTSDNFIAHRHNPKGCDFVLCWIHTQELSLPVLELSTKTFHAAGQPATQPREIKRVGYGVKENGIDKAKLAKAIPKCKAEVQSFIFAFVIDLEMRETYLKAMTKYRLPLSRAGRELCDALNKKGVEVDDMHPYDLFRLIVSLYKSGDMGNLKFIKVAIESVSSIEAILGEPT